MWISRATVQNIQKKNFAFWSMGNPYELLTSKEIRAIEDAYILINNFAVLSFGCWNFGKIY